MLVNENRDQCFVLIPRQVGNEFGQVEGLWSQIENIMAKQPEKEESQDTKEGATEGL